MTSPSTIAQVTKPKMTDDEVADLEARGAAERAAIAATNEAMAAMRDRDVPLRPIAAAVGIDPVTVANRVRRLSKGEES